MQEVCKGITAKYPWASEVISDLSHEVLSLCRRTPFGYTDSDTVISSSTDEVCYWVWEVDEWPEAAGVIEERRKIGLVMKALWGLIRKIKSAKSENTNNSQSISASYGDYLQASTRLQTLLASHSKRKLPDPIPAPTIPKRVKVSRLSATGLTLAAFFPTAVKKPTQAAVECIKMFNFFPKPILPKPFEQLQAKDNYSVISVEKKVVPHRSRAVLYIHDGKKRIGDKVGIGKVRRNPFYRYQFVDYDEESETEEEEVGSDVMVSGESDESEDEEDSSPEAKNWLVPDECISESEGSDIGTLPKFEISSPKSYLPGAEKLLALKGFCIAPEYFQQSESRKKPTEEQWSPEWLHDLRLCVTSERLTKKREIISSFRAKHPTASAAMVRKQISQLFSSSRKKGQNSFQLRLDQCSP